MKKINMLSKDHEYKSTFDHAVLYKENKEGWTWREIEHQTILNIERTGRQVIKEIYGSYYNRGGYASRRTVVYGHENDLVAIGILFHEWGHVVLNHNDKKNYNRKDPISIIMCEIQAWNKAYEKIRYYGFEIPDEIEASKQGHMEWLKDRYGRNLYDHVIYRLKILVDK